MTELSDDAEEQVENLEIYGLIMGFVEALTHEEERFFRFRFLAADGEELLLSRPFSDPKAAGAISQRLIDQGADALELRADEGEQFTLWLDGECLADSPAYAEPDALEAAMLRLRDAIAGLAG